MGARLAELALKSSLRWPAYALKVSQRWLKRPTWIINAFLCKLSRRWSILYAKINSVLTQCAPKFILRTCVSYCALKFIPPWLDSAYTNKYSPCRRTDQQNQVPLEKYKYEIPSSTWTGHIYMMPSANPAQKLPFSHQKPVSANAQSTGNELILTKKSQFFALGPK